jgi:hypothetical protein
MNFRMVGGLYTNTREIIAGVCYSLVMLISAPASDEEDIIE